MPGRSATPDSSRLSAISRLFSSAVFREMAKNGRSPAFARLISEGQVGELCGIDATVGEAFDAAFRVLRRVGQRDEYVYRAALIRKVLLGKHSLNTASVLNEFRAGACKADLVILNGTATAYEIKSERDSLFRLLRQVQNYQKVFLQVYVIASEAHIPTVLDTVPEGVGVMSLGRRFHISHIRHAADGSNFLCAQTIFESLRAGEACAILKELGAEIPSVPNTKLHLAMREAFGQLRPMDVHTAMVKTLKRTRNLAPLSALIDRLPNSLHAAALSIGVHRADHGRLVDAVNTSLDTAIGWG